MKKAFTLAEIMIVLTVIGVLTAILLPIAFQAAPDEDVMKFKKANSTLGTLIRELVNSDRYYKNGDLGTKYDGTLLIHNASGSNGAIYRKYFCESLADIMSTKSVNCSDAAGAGTYRRTISTQNGEPTAALLTTLKSGVDTDCASAQSKIKTPQIVSSDNISWFEANPQYTFGRYYTGTTRLFTAPANSSGSNGVPGHADLRDQFGHDAVYKVICIDVDDYGSGEAPFGYGIRADGKIIPGKRADDWLLKAAQKSK